MLRVGVLIALLAACRFAPAKAVVDAGLDSGDADAPPDTAPDAPACGAVQLAASGYHTCALLADGTVRCWGLDDSYELGLPVTTKCTYMTKMYACSATPVEPTLTGVMSIGAGHAHTCATSASGTYCWGLNLHGAYGDGSKTPSQIPRAIASRSGATAIVAGYYHTCSLAGGKVSCSGQNVAGEVGDGSMMEQDAATSVLSNATSIAAGDYITCAIDTQQNMSCWGQNQYDELDLTGQNKPTPSQIVGVSNAVQVAVGTQHLCVLGSDHGVTCHGLDASGQLGPGALTGVAAISAAHDHTCALDTSGAVTCFGDVYGGALPISIALPQPAIAIASGDYHDCAITMDHRVWCWGDNTYGELGTGMAGGTFTVAPAQAQICP